MRFVGDWAPKNHHLRIWRLIPWEKRLPSLRCKKLLQNILGWEVFPPRVTRWPTHPGKLHVPMLLGGGWQPTKYCVYMYIIYIYNFFRGYVKLRECSSIYIYVRHMAYSLCSWFDIISVKRILIGYKPQEKWQTNVTSEKKKNISTIHPTWTCLFGSAPNKREPYCNMWFANFFDLPNTLPSDKTNIAGWKIPIFPLVNTIKINQD